MRYRNFFASLEFRNRMGWIHPTYWLLYTTIESLPSLNNQKGPPLQTRSYFFSLNLVVRGAKRLARVRFYFFGTRDLRRNLHIWWRVRTTSDDVIFTSKVPSCQVIAIYRIVKESDFFSFGHMTSPNFIFFQKFDLPGIYVETYRYDDVYVRLLMTSYLRQKSHHVRL